MRTKQALAVCFSLRPSRSAHLGLHALLSRRHGAARHCAGTPHRGRFRALGGNRQACGQFQPHHAAQARRIRTVRCGRAPRQFEGVVNTIPWVGDTLGSASPIRWRRLLEHHKNEDNVLDSERRYYRHRRGGPRDLMHWPGRLEEAAHLNDSGSGRGAVTLPRTLTGLEICPRRQSSTTMPAL